MAVDKVNFLNPAIMQAQQPISSIKAVGGQAGAAVSESSKSNNPFGDNSKGVGLVNSDLAGMSYKLPNGKQTVCNTIGIA